MSEKENIPTMDFTGKYPNTNKGRIGFSRQVYNEPQGAKFV